VDLIDEAHRLCLLGLEHPAPQQEVEGRRFTDEAGEALGPSARGEQAKLHFREPDGRLPGGHEAEVAGQRQFAAPAGSMPVNNRDC
jgi:hypothetical protein